MDMVRDGITRAETLHEDAARIRHALGERWKTVLVQGTEGIAAMGSTGEPRVGAADDVWCSCAISYSIEP